MKLVMQTDTPPPLIVAIPLGLARSALFAAGGASSSRDDRRVVAIAPQRGAKLAQSGPALGQGHALAWQAVLHWATDAGIADDRPFTVATDDLWRVLGRKGGDSEQRGRMGRWLGELAQVRIGYRTDLHTYSGPLLLEAGRKERTGRRVLRLPPELPALLSNEILRNDLRRKAALGRDALASWLHDYIATHLRPPPEPVESLQRWSGSGQDLTHFRHALRQALRRLGPEVAETREGIEPGTSSDALVLDWSIDRHDRLHLRKAPTSVAILSAAVVDGPAKRRRVDVRQAREQRARVAL